MFYTSLKLKITNYVIFKRKKPQVYLDVSNPTVKQNQSRSNFVLVIIRFFIQYFNMLFINIHSVSVSFMIEVWL